MRVIGIDPGLRNMGWGVIDVAGSRLTHVANGICHSDSETGDLARRLASRLKEWTGRTWLIAANGQGGGETLIEIEKKARSARRAAVEADPFVVSIMQAFPGAEIKEIKTLAPAVEMPAIPEDDEED